MTMTAYHLVRALAEKDGTNISTDDELIVKNLANGKLFEVYSIEVRQPSYPGDSKQIVLNISRKA